MEIAQTFLNAMKNAMTGLGKVYNWLMGWRFTIGNVSISGIGVLSVGFISACLIIMVAKKVNPLS